MEKDTMWAYPQSYHALTHWKFVLRCWVNCPYIILLTKKLIISIQTQHPQYGFKFIISLRVVLIMVEFYLRTGKYVASVNTNLQQTNIKNIHHKRAIYDVDNNI